MAYVSPFGTRKNESGKEFIAPQRTNYVSPFKTSRVTAEYSSAYKKEQERLSLVKDFNNLDNLPVDQQYRVSQRLKDAGYFTDEQKTQLDAAIKNSAARQEKGSASILEKAISEVGRGAQRLYRNVTEVFTPTAIKNQLATSTRGATIPTTPVIKKPFDTKRIEQDIKDFTASPNLFISGFNSLSALEQRDLINDLNTTVKEYAQSSNQDLADTAARAAILSKYLTTSTKDLEKENFFTDLGLDKDSLRPAYVKPDATKLGLDIAAGTVQQFKDAAYMFGEPLKLAVGRKSTADINLELYQQKKIDKNQYEVNKARIDDYFDRLVGTDTSTGTKLAKGVGWAAWAFSWYYPNSKALRVYQTSLNKSMPSLLKSFLGPVLGSGALNSLSTLTAYERGKKLSKAEFALNFGIGAANASIPFLLIGARRVKINRNLRAQGIDPKVMAGIDELDNAAQVNATTDEVLDILNEKDPAVREKMIEVAGSSLTKEEYAKYRANIDNLIKETDALNLKVRENVELELPETAATTAETTAVTTTTPTADIAVSPAKQLAEEITARNDLVLKPTGAKEGKLTKYNIVDGSGKVVGSLKATSQVKADAQFRAIKANPTTFAKSYPKVFQTIKEKAPTKAQVVKKAAPSVKEQPKAAPKAQRATTGRPVERPVVVKTTRRAPAGRPEAAPVKGRTEVIAKTEPAVKPTAVKPTAKTKALKEPVKPKFAEGKLVAESTDGTLSLRNTDGKTLRKLTPEESKQWNKYRKDRVAYARQSGASTKAQINKSKLEEARAERFAAEAQARIDARAEAEARAKRITKQEQAKVTAKKPEAKEQVYTTNRLMDKELKQGDKIKVKDTVYTYKIEQKKFQDPVEILDSGKVNVDDLYISRKGNKVEVKTQYVGEKPIVSMNKVLTGGEAGYFKEAPKKPKRGLLPKDQGGYVASDYPLERPIIPKNKYKVKTNMNATDELRADRLIGDYNARVADKTINPKKQSFENWGRDWWNTMWSEDKRMYPKIENVVTSADGSVISAKITYAGKTYEIVPKKGFLPKDEGGYIRMPERGQPKKINKVEAASELEKAVTKAEIPEVPVTKEKKLTRAIAGKPEESVTKGAIRISYQALLSDAQNKLPHITELARFTPEQWKPYHDKYLKDFNTRPEYVDDVIAGRVQETGKFQRAAYTLLKEVELRNAATAEEWFRKSINTNIDKSPVYVRASESGQFLSLLSYFQKRYDLNSVISEIETARGKIAQKMYKTKGRELKAEIANQRKLILDEIEPVTAEDTANLIKSYKLGKKSNPLLKEFIGNKPITKEFKGLSIEKRIKLFTEMGSDQRLELLKKVVGEELALRFASDFERKLLLKNQKLGILNWIQNYKNVDPAIKRDLVSQLTKLERILVTNGVENQLDNYINTVLGIRPQMSELKTLFELNQKADKAHQAVLDKFGATKKNDDAWFYATDDPYYKPSEEELKYGMARAQLREYAMNMQKPTMKQEFEIWKNREFLGKVGQAAVTLGNWIRAFVASFDNSALGRQANLVLKTHPKIWAMGAKAGYTTMIRALKAKTPAELNAIKLAFEAAILADPWANDFAEAGLAILKADDMFLSSGPGNLKIKVGDRYIQVGKALKASELAYDMTIQTMRLALAKKLYTKGYKRLEKLNKQEALKYAKDTDFTRIDMDPDFKRNLMVMINSMTGRGEFKSATIEKAVPALNVVFFSTRWTKSQFDKITQGFFGANIGGVKYVVNGQKHWNPVQRMAAANLLKAFAVNASILAMAEMLIPGSTETDYRSADAGKIKIGTTRFDITGGMNQIMTLGARLLARSTKNSNTGVVSKLNSEEWGSRTLWNILDDFFTNKLSPAAGEVARVLKGKDIQRADPSVEATLQRIITPMLFKNLFETGADPNAVPAWIAAFFDFNGISTNTYASKGQGRLGNEWDDSSKGAVKAFRESVDKDVFAQAAAERDDLFNTFIVNLIKTPTYQNANDVDKKYILEKADAEIQERIFKKYGFKYKKQEVRTKQQTEQYKNLIKSNL